jgi:CRISPR-associated protein Cmr6
MTVVPDAFKKVPMMFQAQVDGRCQIQRLDPDKKKHGDIQDCDRWADEWIDKVDRELPASRSGVQTREWSFTWRVLSNSGVDDSVIRPVIGARGYPYYPGSSMKGLFRRACTPEQAARYCGKPLPGNDWEPGLLRFHGGYPVNDDWTHHLVDIVHPQQGRQVKDQSEPSSAFVQVSLYQPRMRFEISSRVALMDEEWTDIWAIWDRAIEQGIGGRVCAGYGQPAVSSKSHVLYRSRVKGQGQAAKLIDETGEFRPNMIRAAVRGHAMRIFGGLTDAESTEQLVDRLFGGIRNREGTAGLLKLRFQSSRLTMATFGKSSYEQPVYDVEGELAWVLTQPTLEATQTETLKKLIAQLTRFAMIFGGFGKSWRRADHRLFFEEYYEDSHKPLIGCHWQWLGDPALRNDVQVRKVEKVAEFVEKVRQTAREWMTLQQVEPSSSRCADWRESWHPQRVQVWGREASDRDDSEAIRWFHGAYQPKISRVQEEGSIYRSSIAGQMGQIGRIWHRMYPEVRLPPPKTPGEKPIPKPTLRFLELLTIFPDGSRESERFLQFLQSQQGTSRGFRRLWGGE